MDDDNEEELKKRLKKSTKEALSRLTAREAKALKIKFGVDMNTDHTLEEVAKQFEITREKIKEIEVKALRKLRKDEGDDPDDNGPDAT